MPPKETLESLRERIKAIESGSLSDFEPDSAGSMQPEYKEVILHTEASSSVGAASSHSLSNSQAKDEDADEAPRALKKIIALLNASDKSEKALCERLSKEGFSRSAIDEAVSKAKEYGFIDDARFAEVLIRSRISQGKGLAGIERELATHEIDPCSVEGWPYEFGVDEHAELDRALDMLRKKPPRSKNLREGAYRKLISKGYSSSISSQAARIWCEDINY